MNCELLIAEEEEEAENGSNQCKFCLADEYVAKSGGKKVTTLALGIFIPEWYLCTFSNQYQQNYVSDMMGHPVL